MRNLIFIFLSVIPGLLFTGPVQSASWETTSMRTPGGGLIRVGMSQQEVLSELGKPLGKHAVTRSATGGKSGTRGVAWSYRADDGLYTLTFAGEKVVKIVVTPKRD